jgi:Domain of unknown function (DUF4280)
MPIQVTTGAMLQCSFGLAPSTLQVLPVNRVMAGGVPAGTIMDHIPIANIPPFGMCSSIANPTVATATTAALGVLTPMPCVPATPSPWLPGAATVLTGGMPALDNTCKLMCLWAGVIQIVSPGQTAVLVP